MEISAGWSRRSGPDGGSAPLKPLGCSCSRGRGRAPGLTLLEVMVVVGIVTALAALLIPNLLRARLTTFEAITTQNLNTLQKSLELYHAANRAYPDAWQADLYTSANPDYGPEGFDADLQTAWVATRGYEYKYQPQPGGCAEPGCTSYQLWARPQNFGTTGTRSFLLGSSLDTRHCVGSAPGALADPADPPITEPPPPC